MEKLVVSRETALEKGYLEKKVIFLKPSPRGGKMIKAPNHIGYFMYEGAKIRFVIPMNKRGEILNVFKSREEQDYFENELGVDLSPHRKKDNFWHTFSIGFSKDPISMHEGMKFDLSDPTDNLRVRILQNCIDVAPTWEQRFASPAYKFALVYEDYEENRASAEATKNQEMWKFFGSVSNNTTKMREFLGVYLADNKKIKTVPADSSKEWLMGELSNLIKEDPDGYLEIVNDPTYEMKAFILNATQVGAVEKAGVNKYVLPGETTSWTHGEFVDYLGQLKENSDDLYLKIKAQINMKNKK